MRVAGPSGVASEKRAPAPSWRRKRAQRRGAGVKVDAKRFRRQQRAQRVLRHMQAGRAEHEIKLAAEDLRLTREPPSIGSTSISRASQSAPRPNLRTRAPRARGFVREPLELRRVAVERGRPPGSRPRKISALASAIASSEPRCSIWTGAIVVTSATCGRAMRDKRRDLAGVIHADLEHAA